MNEMVIREAPTSQEAARLVGHVDRKLVKQVRERDAKQRRAA